MCKSPRSARAAAAAALMLALAGCAPPSGPAQAPGPQAPVAAGAGHRIVAIGDSIMAGYGLPGGQAWPDLLAGTGMDVVNLACSGAGFTTVGDCGTDFAGLIPQAVQAAPDVVLIQSSDNDEAATAEQIRTATADTVAALHAALPHARIIGLSTLWNDPAPAPQAIADATAALRDAVQQAGGSFADIGQPLAGTAGLLQWDDEHPTAAGQEALLHQVTAALESAGITL